MNFRQLAQAIQPTPLSLDQQRARMLTALLDGNRAFDENFIVEYRNIHEQAGVDIGQSVIEHCQPYMERLLETR